MANNAESWKRPWTMEEMIQNSENWSLAGDVALLNSIKAYADNLLSKTLAISDNVDNLLNDLNEVGLKLDLSQNEFQSLRNTQFIESRVYEDDETLDFKEEAKKEKKEPSEEEKEKLIKQSIVEGLQVVDKYFDKIEVSISDSEEESDKSYVLQVKDLYADRPLPLIIGSEEWYKKWHVGLAESSSESESEKVTETYSESDSGDDLPKDLLKGSETSSELDFSSQASENRPVANSTFNDSVKKPDIFASDEESEQGSLPVKTPLSNKTFAEQLAARLGNVISEREDVSPEVNRKPIQPAKTNKFAGDLFSDEPPPLDDLEDTVLPKSAQSGLFSGGQGLFDDNEDELFWGKQSEPVIVEERENEVKGEETVKANRVLTKHASLLPKSSQVSKGLFDSDSDSSDEDIFAANRKQLSKQPFLQPFKNTLPLFTEEPPELEVQKKTTEESAKKKPVGGVSVFGSHNLFEDKKILKNQSQSTAQEQEIVVKPKKDDSAQENILSSEESVKPKKISLFDEDEVDTDVKVPPKKPEPKPNTKKISLFDEDDDLFKGGLFSDVSSKKVTSNLFDDVEEKEDLFATSSNNNAAPKVDLFSELDDDKDMDVKKTVSPKKVLSLFSDQEDEEEEDIFGHKSNVTNKKDDLAGTIDVPNTNSINSNVDEGFEVTNTVESVGKTAVKEEVSTSSENAPQRQVIGAERTPVAKKLTRGLFDDYEEDADDFFKEIVGTAERNVGLFEDAASAEAESPTVVSAPQIENKETIECPKSESPPPEPPKPSKTGGTVSLFGSSPPPDDDEWDAKSDRFSDTEDQFSYRIESDSAGLSLFDNEPPSLGPNESSGIVRDQNLTRVDTDDSSFNPYASSSRRLSSDVFNEQQSQDSFFVTRNKTESINVPPSLDIIPEVTSSNVDITPSGNLSDLEDSNEDNSASNDTSVFLPNTSRDKILTKKPVSLFDDDYKHPSESEDLFSSKTESESGPKLSENRLTLFDNIQNTLEEKNGQTRNDTSGNDTNNGTEQAETSEKPTKKAEDAQSGAETAPYKALTGSPGKLKHNLKINVNALVPGYAPPKLRDLSKSQSLDLPKEQDEAPTSVSTPDVRPTSAAVQKEATLVRAVSFENALDNVEVLHSVTKDRAKIPIKRRPSTRRGRQQAIRTSAAEFSLESDNAAESTDVNAAQEGERMDIEPPKKDPEMPPIEQPSSGPTGKSDVDDVFSKAPAKVGKVANADKSKTSIFDSGESDTELFGPSEKKSKKDVKSKDLGSVGKKSLFNDSSSDDDLFSGTKRKGNTVRPVEKKAQKTSVLRKLENIEADDDPLSSLLK